MKTLFLGAVNKFIEVKAYKCHMISDVDNGVTLCKLCHNLTKGNVESFYE